MHPSFVPPRPDGRNTPAHPTTSTRASHALPSRPDLQPARNRQPERLTMDRPAEHTAHHRYESRASASDYGRLDRPVEPVRHYETSPGRHTRPSGGRTPERMQPGSDHREWSGRDSRDYDDRAVRAPQRDTRVPTTRPHAAWELRDNRDMRDQRDRPDLRPHVASASTAMEPRRMPSTSSLAHENAIPRRDGPPNYRQAGERADMPQQQPIPPNPIAAPSAGEGPPVDPARAAIINHNEQHGLPDLSRQERDGRRDRNNLRPQSPRRGEDWRGEERRGNDRQIEERLPFGYHGRHEAPRDYRDERGSMQAPFPTGRDRRNDPAASTPTGPRVDRAEPTVSSRSAREAFQPNQGPRPFGYQTQNPNYGRLNQPPDSMPPLGPRSDRSHGQSQPSTPTTLGGASTPVGIHPSRFDNIQGNGPTASPIQTDFSNPPSGPRGSGRLSSGPMSASTSSPVGRGAPTGPAANDRGPRNAGNPLRAINHVLAQNTPADRLSDRSTTPQNPTVRGRGASRANDSMMDISGGMPSPMPPPLHISTPTSRSEGQQLRNSRIDVGPAAMEAFYPEDGRLDSRGYRESRRSERFGHERSVDRSERRPDERSNRNIPIDRLGPPEEDRGLDRERREKRGSERESSRRDRERESGERASREPGRRERVPREDGRTSSGRDDRDRRSRLSGGSVGSGEDIRKRLRESTDQGRLHGDIKRRHQ